MKRIFLTSLLLIVLLFSLTGCSNSEPTKDYNSNEDKNVSEELQMEGTGKINLKELVESPKLASKLFSELTTKDVKTFYNVDESDQYGSKTINGIEFSSYYSNDGETTIEKDGVSVTIKDEYFNITNGYNSSVSMRSKEVLVDEAFPEELEIKSLNFSTILKNSSVPEEQQLEMYDNTVYFLPYMKENNCKSIVDFAKALGFEETDKTMLYAIQNNVEYSAEYESDYGAINVAYFPGVDMDSKILTFSFEDESSWLSSIEFNSMRGMNGDEEFEELQVNFMKK